MSITKRGNKEKRDNGNKSKSKSESESKSQSDSESKSNSKSKSQLMFKQPPTLFLLKKLHKQASTVNQKHDTNNNKINKSEIIYTNIFHYHT